MACKLYVCIRVLRSVSCTPHDLPAGSMYAIVSRALSVPLMLYLLHRIHGLACVLGRLVYSGWSHAPLLTCQPADCMHAVASPALPMLPLLYLLHRVHGLACVLGRLVYSLDGPLHLSVDLPADLDCLCCRCCCIYTMQGARPGVCAGCWRKEAGPVDRVQHLL